MATKTQHTVSLTTRAYDELLARTSDAERLELELVKQHRRIKNLQQLHERERLDRMHAERLVAAFAYQRPKPASPANPNPSNRTALIADSGKAGEVAGCTHPEDRRHAPWYYHSPVRPVYCLDCGFRLDRAGQLSDWMLRER